MVDQVVARPPAARLRLFFTELDDDMLVPVVKRSSLRENNIPQPWVQQLPGDLTLMARKSPRPAYRGALAVALSAHSVEKQPLPTQTKIIGISFIS